jgi:hypothetical protein
LAPVVQAPVCRLNISARVSRLAGGGQAPIFDVHDDLDPGSEY